MAHGGYGKRRVKPAARRSKSLGVEKKPKPKPKAKPVTLKNQIRSIERMLRKVLLVLLNYGVWICLWTFFSLLGLGFCVPMCVSVKLSRCLVAEKNKKTERLEKLEESS